MKLEWPRIETRDSWITVGIDKDLNVALDILKAETTKFLMESRKIGKDEAEKLMLASWDCRVSQVVDVNKGLHCFSSKSTHASRRAKLLPVAENRTYLVTVGKDTDLNKAMDAASWAMTAAVRPGSRSTAARVTVRTAFSNTQLSDVKRVRVD
jgi:hypothetical protein